MTTFNLIFLLLLTVTFLLLSITSVEASAVPETRTIHQERNNDQNSASNYEPERGYRTVRDLITSYSPYDERPPEKAFEVHSNSYHHVERSDREHLHAPQNKGMRRHKRHHSDYPCILKRGCITAGINQAYGDDSTADDLTHIDIGI